MRALLAALLVTTGIGQPAPPPGAPVPPPGRLVTVDVTVTDARGRTLADLKPSDFELREGGTLLPLESVRRVRVDPASPGETPVRIQSAADERLAAGQEEARLFAIFLDEYHVASGAETDRVRETLRRFVDRDVSPHDLIVVMKPLDSLLTIRLTRDREAVRQTIEGFEGRKGDYQPRNGYERDYIAATPARIDVARSQLALSAINALAVHLGSLTDRRKTLIVATETVGRTDRRRDQEYLPTLDTVIRSANRSNVAVYPFDPRAAASQSPAADLRRLADETDGQEIVADAESGLRRVTADSSAYYLLSFRTTHPDDGQFRELLARVKRAGAVVRARKGYWTASPDEALRAALIAKAAAPKVAVPLEPAPHTSTLIRPWFGIARGENGKTRVTFVWEPAGHVPGDRVRRTVSKLEFLAKSSDGTVLFEGPVAPTGNAAVDEPFATPARISFEVPPGRLRVRMSIQDAASTVLDQDVREMSIRSMDGDVAVGTPEILRARNAREFRALDSASAAPVASREFSRTERLLIRFGAYGPGSLAPAVSARLLDRMGHPMRTLVVTPAPAAGDNTIDLPLAGFAPGDYTIEVKAASGAREATERTPFRITY
ncbi:MAG: VWA domain-containing protein [Vicinamibacterales bacterium]